MITAHRDDTAVSQGWSETVKRQASASRLAFRPIFREEEIPSSGWGLMYTFAPSALATCSISSYCGEHRLGELKKEINKQCKKTIALAAESSAKLSYQNNC